YSVVYAAISISLIAYGSYVLNHSNQRISNAFLSIRYFSWYAFLVGICGLIIVSSGVLINPNFLSPQQESISTLIVIFNCIVAVLVFSENLRKFKEQYQPSSYSHFEKNKVTFSFSEAMFAPDEKEIAKVVAFFSSSAIAQPDIVEKKL